MFLNDEKRYGLRVKRTELEPNGSESKSATDLQLA